MGNEVLGMEENPLNDVLFVVLLYKNENFNSLAPYDIEICGKKMWEWVALSGSGASVKTLPVTKDSDIVNLIKPYITNEKYVVALYSDTPLISRETVLEIFEHFKNSGQNVLKLKRGIMLNAEYLKNCESIMSLEDERFDCDEFMQVESFKNLPEITAVINNAILNYHMENGVQFVDPKSTFIDADVVIEKNVTIYPNNTIKGQTYIGENVVLEPNNTIINSVISKGAIIKNSYLSGAGISENMIIGPFEKVIDKNC